MRNPAGTPTKPDHPTGVFYLIHELSRLTASHFDKAMEREGLSHAQWWMLMHIAQHAGATQSEVAAISSMGRAAAGELLTRMEERGWVERRADAADGRIRRIYLAERASSVLDAMTAEGTHFFEKALRGLSPLDVGATARTLTGMKCNLQQ